MLSQVLKFLTNDGNLHIIPGASGHHYMYAHMYYTTHVPFRYVAESGKPSFIYW